MAEPRGGGLGARAPPPQRGRECPKYNNKNRSLYDFASIYGNAYLDDKGLPTILLKGGTDRAVSVIRACK